MWLALPSKSLRLKNFNSYESTAIYYNSHICFFFKASDIKWSDSKAFTHNHWLFAENPIGGAQWNNYIIKYSGKAFKISKRGNIFILKMHYPTFKGMVWQNIKIKYSRRKRKFFKFSLGGWWKSSANAFNNLVVIRAQNTYTGRGIFISSIYKQQRKPKTSSKR